MNFLGFTFNNKHCSEFGIYIQTRNIPLLPSQRVSEETVIGRDGSYKFEEGYNDKIIEIDCSFLESDFNKRRQKLREIAGWLSQKGELIFDNEADKAYIGKIYNQIDLEMYSTFDQFTLIFVCEPFAYSRWDNSELLQYYTKGFEIDGQYIGYMQTTFNNITSNITVTLANLGNYYALPTIEIDGTADSVVIGTDENSFNIVNITEKTYVDCKNMIVYTLDEFGKKQNKLQDFEGNFIKLKSGLNEISVEGTNLNLSSVFFNYRNTYL
ncbi:MAG: hypothetical protein PWQ70_2695 [Clostridiales bacterium]|nr:hypothetical protein [Clostridiales bacterium]